MHSMTHAEIAVVITLGLIFFAIVTVLMLCFQRK
jgi:hypothetical protein